ncbi:MAG: hypothetical protein SFU87_06640 [Chitinophagaceae bacterium]|nr:hypothetical protein [Chitinophagaceae bacterium]
MKKIFYWLAFFLWISSLTKSQDLSNSDYEIYSILISWEIHDTTKSITILKKLIEIDDYSPVVHAIKSNNEQEQQVTIYSWTEDQNGNRPAVIDDATKKLILDYSEFGKSKYQLQNKFKLKAETYLVKNSQSDLSRLTKAGSGFTKRTRAQAGFLDFPKSNIQLIIIMQFSITGIEDMVLLDMVRLQ